MCSRYASEHGFDVITTTNATSRWKDANQVNASGSRAADKCVACIRACV